MAAKKTVDAGLATLLEAGDKVKLAVAALNEALEAANAIKLKVSYVMKTYRYGEETPLNRPVEIKKITLELI